MSYIPSKRSLKSLDEAMFRHDGSVVATGPWDLNYNEIRKLVVYSVDDLPVTYRTGMLVFNKKTRTLWVHTGITWYELKCQCTGGGGGGTTIIQQTYQGETNTLLSPTHQRFSFRAVSDPYETYAFMYKNYLIEEQNKDSYSDVGEIGAFQNLELKHKAQGLFTGEVSSNFRIGCILRSFRNDSVSYTSHEYFNGMKGTVIKHGLGTENHNVFVSGSFLYDNKFFPSTISDVMINKYMADIGVPWVQVGNDFDIVYNTGSDGLKFDYYANVEDLYQKVTPTKTGAVYSHNRGNKNRLTAYTLTTTNTVNPDRVANIGDIYVILGNNYDTIYCTGETYQDVSIQVATLDAGTTETTEITTSQFNNLWDILSRYATIKYVDDKFDAYDRKNGLRYATKEELREGLANMDEKKAEKNHKHLMRDITDSNEILDGKANKVHTHYLREVLDAEAALNQKANREHEHNQYTTREQMTAALKQKAELNHAHNYVTPQTLDSELEKMHKVTGGIEEMTEGVSYLKSGDVHFVYKPTSEVEDDDDSAVSMTYFVMEVDKLMSPLKQYQIKPYGASSQDLGEITYEIRNIQGGLRFDKVSRIGDGEIVSFTTPSLTDLKVEVSFDIVAVTESGESNPISYTANVLNKEFLITTSQTFEFELAGTYKIWCVGGGGGTAGAVESNYRCAPTAGGGGGGSVYDNVPISKGTQADIVIGAGGGIGPMDDFGQVGLGGGETKVTIGSNSYTAGGGGGGGLYIRPPADSGVEEEYRDFNGGGGGGGGGYGTGSDGVNNSVFGEPCGGDGGGFDGGLGGKITDAGVYGGNGKNSTGGGYYSNLPGTCTLEFAGKNIYGNGGMGKNEYTGTVGNQGCVYIELIALG